MKKLSLCQGVDVALQAGRSCRVCRLCITQRRRTRGMKEVEASLCSARQVTPPVPFPLSTHQGIQPPSEKRSTFSNLQKIFYGLITGIEQEQVLPVS